MPHNPRPHMAILQRQEQVARLYAQGVTQQAIADQLHASQSTIQRDIEAVEKRWQAETLTHHTTRKNRLLESVTK